VSIDKLHCGQVQGIVNSIFDSVWKVIMNRPVSAGNITDVINNSCENSKSVDVDVTNNNKASIVEGISNVSNINLKSRVFPCSTCGKLFSQFPSAAKHCTKRHNDLSVNCPICGKEIKEKRNMKRHLETHKVKKKKIVTKCEGCGKIFSTKQRLDYHMGSKHGAYQTSTPVNTQVFKCSECTFSHVKLSVVKTHFGKAHAEDDTLACDSV
jgi:DNA-directed RNA polymerase subunit RPC12/RpoP